MLRAHMRYFFNESKWRRQTYLSDALHILRHSAPLVLVAVFELYVPNSVVNVCDDLPSVCSVSRLCFRSLLLPDMLPLLSGFVDLGEGRTVAVSPLEPMKSDVERLEPVHRFQTGTLYLFERGCPLFESHCMAFKRRTRTVIGTFARAPTVHESFW